MCSGFARRLLVLLLSVALATGLTVRVVEVGGMDMTAAAMATTDIPGHGKCDGCAGSEKAMVPTACFAHCGGVAALPAMLAALDPVAGSIVAPALGPAETGHAAAPEPYPPRPSILS